MSRGQAPPRRAQPEDVGSGPLPFSTAMPHPSARPGGHTLAQPPGGLTLTQPPGGLTLTQPPSTNHSTLDILNNTNNTNSSSSFHNSGAGRVVPAVRYLGVQATNPVSTTEDYAKLKEEFYQSYSPQVGLHTAAVLGGILGWLIIYLLYKTKVKKWVVRFVKRKYKQRKERRLKKKACEAFAECQDIADSRPDPDLHPARFQCPPHVKNNHLQQQQRLQFSYPDYQPLQQDPNPLSPPLGCCRQLQRGNCQNPPSQQSRPNASCCPGNPIEQQQQEQQQQQQQRPMPSIVVESYSALPLAGAACRPHAFPASQDQPCVDTCQPHAPKARRKSARQEKAQQQEQQPHRQEGEEEGGGPHRQQGREKRKRHRRKRSRSQTHQCPEVTVLDVDEPDTKSLHLPPGTQADAARATARWVQTMPLLMQSHRDFTGLILKIQPSMVGSQKQQSCPLISAALQFAALPLLGLPNVGWNNSMPHLANNGLGALKDGGDPDFSAGDKGELSFTKKKEKEEKDVEDLKDLSLLQPLSGSSLPYAARPQSALSQPESSSSPSRRPPALPPRSPSCRPPALPPRSPPRLTTCIPGQAERSSSAANLSVPGAGSGVGEGVSAWLTPAGSAPASPVPIPVTPTVTIQNSTSRVSRGHPRSLQQQQQQHQQQRRDSRDSASSSSSLEPLLHVQHDCRCPSSSAASSRQQPQHHHHQHHHRKPSPRSSWTVFDDDVDESGGGGCCGHNSYPSPANSNSSPLPRCGQKGADSAERPAGPHDPLLTLETKL